MLGRVGVGDEDADLSFLSGGGACGTSLVGGAAGVGTGVGIAGAAGGVVAFFTEGAPGDLTGPSEDEAVF